MTAPDKTALLNDLRLIDLVAAQAPVNRQDHVAVQQALQRLVGFVEANAKPVDEAQKPG